MLIPVEAFNKVNYDLYKDHGAPELGSAMSGPSVSNLALDIAVRLGCNPVVLIGQDLALRDGKSHATGNFYRTEITDFSKHIKVKGNTEDFVYTDKSWLSMLKYFEYQVNTYPDTNVINATEGGAFIPGTTVRTLREVIDEHMTEEKGVEEKITTIIAKTPKMTVDAKAIQNKVAESVKSIEKMVETGLEDINKLQPYLKHNTLSSKTQRLIKRIKKNEDTIIESLVYQHIVKSVIYGRLMYYERYYSQMASEKPEQVELWVVEYQKILFTAIRDAIKAFWDNVQPASEDDGHPTEGSALHVQQ